MVKKAEKNPEAPEAEEWVRVDAQGEPLADQGPTAEEVQARLMAANRAHTETLGDAWAVLTGQNHGADSGHGHARGRHAPGLAVEAGRP